MTYSGNQLIKIQDITFTGLPKEDVKLTWKRLYSVIEHRSRVGN